MPDKMLFLYVSVIMPWMVLGLAMGMVVLTSWSTTGRWFSFFEARSESSRRELRVLYVMLAVLVVLTVGLTVSIVWST